MKSPSHLYVSLLRNRTAEGGDPFESPLSFSQQQSASLHLSTLQRRIHTLVTICRQAFSRRREERGERERGEREREREERAANELLTFRD